MRLLLCLDCKTAEELPDFEGNPEDDVLLEELVRRHRGPAPVPVSKINRRLDYRDGEEHLGNLLVIEDKHWSKYRTEILEQIKSEHTGFDKEFYDSKNTFIEDAGKCYNAHQRPQGFCIDWKDKSKRIGNPLKESVQKVYLCDFCVVSSRVLTEQHDAGLWTP